MRGKLYRKAKHSSLLMTFVIVAAFVICWAPYYIVMIGYVFDMKFVQNDEIINKVVFGFGMLESMVNPIIYGAFHLAKRRRGNTRGNSTMVTSMTHSKAPSYKRHSTRGDTHNVYLREETTVT